MAVEAALFKDGVGVLGYPLLGGYSWRTYGENRYTDEYEVILRLLTSPNQMWDWVTLKHKGGLLIDNFIDESQGLCPIMSILSGLMTPIKRKSCKRKSSLILELNFATLFERFYGSV